MPWTSGIVQEGNSNFVKALNRPRCPFRTYLSTLGQRPLADDWYQFLLSLNVPALLSLRLGKREWRNKAWGTEKASVTGRVETHSLASQRGEHRQNQSRLEWLYLWVKRQQSRHVERSYVPCKRLGLALSRDSEEGLQAGPVLFTQAQVQTLLQRYPLAKKNI